MTTGASETILLPIISAEFWMKMKVNNTEQLIHPVSRTQQYITI